MTDILHRWFASRTSREKLLLQVCAFLVVILGGGWVAFGSAFGFRSQAADDLASAIQLRNDVARLEHVMAASGSVQLPESDGTARGIAVAAASQFGLSPTQIEPAGPTGVHTAFAPASSLSFYRWVDAVERAGLVVTHIVLVRAGDGDVVRADATIGMRSS